jgi:hypothetical protein
MAHQIIGGVIREPGERLRVDYRLTPGRGELPDGSFASRFGSGLQTGSCAACKTILAGYVSLAAAIDKGFTCAMYGQDVDQLGFCFRQARPGMRN